MLVIVYIGYKAMFVLCLHRGSSASNLDSLPTSSTCGSILALPSYSRLFNNSLKVQVLPCRNGKDYSFGNILLLSVFTEKSEIIVMIH